MANTTSEMPPTMYEGFRPSNGNRNPVRLVSRVVVKKIAVQPSRRLPLSRPYMTMNPVPIPARLRITCSKVKVERDIPRTIVGVLSEIFVERPRVQQYDILRATGGAEDSEIADGCSKADDSGFVSRGGSRLRRSGRQL